MEQTKELWNLIFNWFGNGKKMILGTGLLVAGIIGQIISDKTLAQLPFVLMATGVLCFVNALFSKITSHSINILIFLVINVVMIEALIATSSIEEQATRFGVWAILVIAAWLLHTRMIRAERLPKRAVLAFLETLLCAVAIVAAFILPIILEVWKRG